MEYPNRPAHSAQSRAGQGFDLTARTITRRTVLLGGLACAAVVALPARKAAAKPLSAAAASAGRSPLVEPATFTGPGLEPYVFDFYTPGDTQGFGDFVGLGSDPVAQNRHLDLQVADSDPSIKTVDELNLDASVYKYVKLSMQNKTGGSTASIYFRTDTDGTWNQAKSKTVRIHPNDANYTEYVVDMSTVPAWSGTIRQVRIDPENGASNGSVSIDEVGFHADPTPRAICFDFDSPMGELDGCTDFANCSASAAGSILSIRPTSVDPRFRTPVLSIEADVFRYVTLRMRNGTAGRTGTIYFTTATDGTVDQAKSLSFAINADDDDFTEYLIDMRDCALWSGSVRQLRIDPENGASTGLIEIDWIRISPDTIAPEISIDFSDGAAGWTAVSGATLSTTGGALTVTNQGAGPTIGSPTGLGWDARKYQYLTIRLQNNTGSNTAVLSWITDADATYDGQKSQRLIIEEPSAGYVDYVIGLSQHQYWLGTITQIRLTTSEHDPDGSSSIALMRLSGSADTSRNNRQVREGWVLPPNVNNFMNGWELNENGGQFIGNVNALSHWWNNDSAIKQEFGGASDFSQGARGWGAVTSCTFEIATTPAGGRVMRVTATGPRATIASPDQLGIDAASVGSMTLTCQNATPDTAARIYFITDADAEWNEAKSIPVTLTPQDSAMSAYVISTDVPTWRGTIRQIRWTVLQTATSGTVDITAFQPNFRYAWMITDQQDDAFISAWKTLPTLATGTLQWEIKVAVEEAGAEGLEWRLSDGIGGAVSDAAIRLVISGGALNVVTLDGTFAPVATLVRRRDYRIMVAVDLDQWTYDVWVDGVQKSSALPFLGDKIRISKAYVGTTTESTVTAVMSESLYKVGFAHDDFYSYPVGATPVEYKGTAPAGSTVTVRPRTSIEGNGPSRSSGIDIHAQAGKYTVTRQFPKATGIVEYQVDFMLPEKLARVQLTLSGGSGPAAVVTTSGGDKGSLFCRSSGGRIKLWEDYLPGVWYTLVILADTFRRTASLYINGVQCAVDVPFPRGVSYVDRAGFTVPAAGHLCVNNLRVAPHYPTTVPHVDAVNDIEGYVGMQSWHFWSSTYETWDRTQAKLKISDKRPYLGFIDELTPETIDWEIKYLAEHGVDFISQFYYRGLIAGAPAGTPQTSHIGWLDTYLDRCHEFSDKMQFAICLSFEDVNTVDDAGDLVNTLFPYLTERYFRNPRYLTFEGKPVIFTYADANLAAKVGGEPGAKAALDRCRAWLSTRKNAEGTPFSGAIFVGESRPIDATTDTILQLKRGGFDYVYGYCNTYSLDDLNSWRSLVDTNDMEAIACPSCMWDNRYWFTLCWTFPNVPSQFHAINSYVKSSYLPSYPPSSLASRMVFIDHWAEFGEGHSILPTGQYGFRWLDVIRQVYTSAPVDHLDTVPAGPYDALYTKGWKAEILRNGDFETGLDYWYSALSKTSQVAHSEPPFEYIDGQPVYEDYDRFAAAVTDRQVPTCDLLQDITAALCAAGSGTVLDLSAYIKSDAGVKDGIVYVATDDASGTHYQTVSGRVDDTQFTNIRGEVRVTWTGKLTRAEFGVRGNDTDTGDFIVDNASARRIR